MLRRRNPIPPITARLRSHTLCQPFPAPFRAMSTNAPDPPKHEYLVILPDHPDVLSKRLKIRPTHLQGLTPHIDSGFWTFGGAMLSEPIKPGDAAPPAMKGSVMLALARSEEEVRERLKKDVYVTEGVWDWEKVVVYPFKSAFRKELR